MSNENHRASCQDRFRWKKRTPRFSFFLLKYNPDGVMFRCQAEITRRVRPAALAILIYIGGYIYPAASMAMYSIQPAQDRLPPDSTPALWFLTQRSAAWQHHKSCPTECIRDKNAISQHCLHIWRLHCKGDGSVQFEAHTDLKCRKTKAAKPDFKLCGLHFRSDKAGNCLYALDKLLNSPVPRITIKYSVSGQMLINCMIVYL